MLTTIRDPRIAQGFSVLSQVLGRPNAQAAIEADLNAKRRDLLLAQIESERTQDLIRRNQMANTGIFQADIANMPDLSQTPQGIAQIFSSVPGMGADAMKVAPGFVSGVRASGADPNFVNDPNFGSVLLGTGVVSDYGNTPQGMREGFQNQQDLQTLKDQGEMDRQQQEQLFAVQHPGVGVKSNPQNFDPKDIAAIWEQVAVTLENMGIAADGTTRNAIMPSIVSQMRTNGGNIDAAIQNTLSGFDQQQVDENGWWPGGGTTRLVPKSSPAGVPADNPAAAGPAPTQPAAGTIQEGQTATNPQTGEQIVFMGGQWVPVDSTPDPEAPAPTPTTADTPTRTVGTRAGRYTNTHVAPPSPDITGPNAGSSSRYPQNIPDPAPADEAPQQTGPAGASRAGRYKPQAAAPSNDAGAMQAILDFLRRQALNPPGRVG